MNLLARAFFYGYALMLLGVGASGMFIAPWELATVFDVDLASMEDLERATLLNQYRFLKALELAFGLFCITYRREILQERPALTVFLAGLMSGVAARSASWWVDGTPRPVFLAFAALELATGVFVWLDYRGRRLA